MTRLAALLLSALVSACAAPGGQGFAGQDARFSANPFFGQLKAELAELPSSLPAGFRQSIVKAADGRVAGQESAPGSHLIGSSRDLLQAILAATDDPVLLPDAEFSALKLAVVGDRGEDRAVFSEALAGYLVAPDFPCQQPTFARYLRQRLGDQRPLPVCPVTVPIELITPYDGLVTLWLDPKRVRSIHVLFASESAGMASRFGHVALRLVVCPDATSSDEVCDANLMQHIAIGFRAHIDEFSLDVFKALSGRYKAYLIANRFLDVYEEYAITEFRSLYSLPLRLQGKALEDLVRGLAEIHWRYEGDYSFLSRNCASMLQMALQSAWPAFASDTELADRFVRPDRLFSAMRRSAIAQGQLLDSLPVAERQGHYFSSTEPYFLKAVKVLSAEMQPPVFASLDEFLNTDPLVRRENRIRDQRFYELLRTDRYLREAQLMLEEYAMLRGERLLMLAGTQFLEETGLIDEPDRLLSTLAPAHAKVVDECLIRPLRSRNAAFPRLDSIPGSAEIGGLSTPGASCQSLDGKQKLHDAVMAIAGASPEPLARLTTISRYWAESINNVKLLQGM